MKGFDKGRPVAIVGGVRLPFCKAGTAYAEIPAPILLQDCLKELVTRFSLKNQILGEVALGTTFYPPSTWNMAREAVLKSGLSWETPAVGIQRACATSLDATIMVADKIASGRIESGIAGGVESISTMALFYKLQLAQRVKKTVQAKTALERISAWRGFGWQELKPQSPATVEPSSGRSMGEHCEMMAKEWKITRGQQDELALESHRSGTAAYQRGFYGDLIWAYQGVSQDNNLRGNGSLEKMAKLSPVFDRSGGGTLTAANSSPLTDGAACVFLASEEWAKKNRLPVLAYLTGAETTAVDIKNEGLLMAPAFAVPRLLDRMQLSLGDFDFYEIHEAFAAQVLCTLKAWESLEFAKRKLGRETPVGSIDRKKLNVVGGSVALGHPFGATGARLVSTLAKLLEEKGTGRGLLSICTGGGMGTVAVLER